MILADILLWLLIIAGGWLALTASWLTTFAIAPRFTEECQQRYTTHGIWAVLIGVMTLVPLSIIAIALFRHDHHPLARMIAVLILLTLMLLALLGSSGLAARVGAGLGSPLDGAQPWRRVMRGGWVLSASFLMPLVGWFLLLPLTLLSGLGTTVLVCWRRKYPHAAVA